jgi:hypothetical protein
VAIASWAYLLNALSALAMGWLADRWIRAGRSPTIVYKGIMAANHIAGIACMIGMVILPAVGVDCSAVCFRDHQRLFLPRIVRNPADPRGPRCQRSLGRRTKRRR